jgi:hypothetical protein
MITEYANSLKESDDFKILLLREVAIVKNELLELDESLLEDIAQTIEKYSDRLIKESASENYEIVLSSKDYLAETQDYPFFWESKSHLMFNEKCVCIYNDELKEFTYYQMVDSAKLSEGERLNDFKNRVSSKWKGLKKGTKNAVVGATMLGAGLTANYALSNHNPVDPVNNKYVQNIKSFAQVESEYKSKLNKAISLISNKYTDEDGDVSLSKKDYISIERELQNFLIDFSQDRDVMKLNAEQRAKIHRNLESNIDIHLKNFKNNISWYSNIF